MSRRFLVISNDQSMTVTVIMNALTGAGFETRFSQPDMALLDMSNSSQVPENILYYVDEDLSTMEEIMHSLAIRLNEKTGLSFYVVAGECEAKVIRAFIADDKITDIFLKPLNVQGMIAQILLNLKIADANGPKKKILVVDDDGIALRTMKNILSGDYEVFMANSAENALSLLLINNVDLILMDYAMPDVSGLELLERLRADSKLATIPVIFLTAKDDKETVFKVLQAKPAHYMLKSSPADEIKGVINRFFM